MVAFATCGVGVAQGDAQKKAAPPKAEARQAILKTLQQRYVIRPGDTIQQRVTLAKKLVEDARSPEVRGNADNRYVWLEQARDLFAKSVELQAAFRVIEALDLTHEVPVQQQKAQAIIDAGIVTAVGTNRPRDARAVSVAIDWLEMRARHQDLEVPEKLFNSIFGLIVRAGAESLRDRFQELRAQFAEYKKVKSALDTLAAQPSDGEANLAAGRYYCLRLCDFEKGLAMLEKSSSESLRSLVDLERAKPTEPQEKMALAGRWYDFGNLPQSTNRGRAIALGRALEWYRSASEGLQPPLRLEADKQIAQIERSLVRLFEQECGLPAGSKQLVALTHGLSWLARHQNKDGSWSASDFSKLCGGSARCEHAGYSEHSIGLTALSLLAFLDAGCDDQTPIQWYDPVTTRMVHVGDVVKRGLKYLCSVQDERGSFVPPQIPKWTYSHALATLCMAEAASRSWNPALRASAQKAVHVLMEAQNPAPGGSGRFAWRYKPQSGDNDTSVTGWCVLALHAARRAELVVDPECFSGAESFCREVTDWTNGLMGYTKREEAGWQVSAPGKNDDYQNHPTLAAMGMNIHALGWGYSDEQQPSLAALRLSKDLPEWNLRKKSNDYYYWYHGSAALLRFDGPDGERKAKGEFWDAWKNAMLPALLSNQRMVPSFCPDGSWDGDDRWGFEGGRVYATAMNLRTLMVVGR
ncbi:MAG: terpene cyclase/mutase family protein [Planctomycetes bacterium]|nr:terpene cyclase/mutase family protein [Planctomycetota bacterium]